MSLEPYVQLKVRENSNRRWIYAPICNSVDKARKLAYRYYPDPEYTISVWGQLVESRKAGKVYRHLGKPSQAGLPTLGKKR